jgi:hypothetical protein
MLCIAAEVASHRGAWCYYIEQTSPFSPSEHNRFIVSTCFGSFTYVLELIFLIWLCTLGEWCFCIPRRLSLECILSGRSGVTVFKWRDFHFLVVVMHSTFITWDSAVQKIISITFIVSMQLLTSFQSCCLHYG